jgi:hypothetical protein
MPEKCGMSRGLALAAAALLTFAGTANASLIWDGNANNGTGVFSLINKGNCFTEGSSSITAVNDPGGQFGTVWRYHKPSDSNRCENHGIRVGGSEYRVTNGQVIFYGWRMRINTLQNNNANFQWKSYGDGHQQNFPFVFKMVSNTLRFMYTPPGGGSVYIWQRSISANQWNHIVLRLNISTSASTGSADLWFNGAQQTFSNGSTRYNGRTLDVGNHNCPKWGVYGGSGTDMSNWVHGLKAGTTYADVEGGGGGNPTPTPAPTATPGPGPTNTPVPTATPGPTPTPCAGCGFSGYYRIMGVQSGRALVVQSASTANSASVIVWDYNDNTSDNDEWEIRSIGSGYHRIIARHSGRDMTVASASTANGANIFQYTYGGSATNDEWQIVDSGGGQYEIRNRNSGKNVQAMGTANGAAVQQQTDDDGSDQRYQLISIP